MDLSLRLEEKTESPPLRVDLPPTSVDSAASKLFNLDELTQVSCEGSQNSEGSPQGDAQGNPLRGQETEEKKARRNITVEDFGYGEQLETLENSKQEWFFTLYNFDGHGRITKEDLGSLLKALYDAVGSSIQLPPKGAKTLKLRLSVGQDQTAHFKKIKSDADMSRNTVSNSKMTKCKVKDFSKLNNLMQAHPKVSNHSSKTTATLTNQDSKATSRLTNQLVEAGGGSPAQLLATPRRQAKQLSRRQNKEKVKESNLQAPRQRYRHSGTFCPVLAAASALHTTQLARTVKAETCATAKAEPAVTRVRAKVTAETEKPAAKESQDRRNYYLDLAGIENTCSRFQNDLSGNGEGATPHQSRSRSYDITKNDNLRGGVGRSGEEEAPCPTGKWDNVHRENERLRTKQGKGCPKHHHQSRAKTSDCFEVLCQPSRTSRKSHHHHQQEHSGGQASTSLLPGGCHRHSTCPDTSELGRVPHNHHHPQRHQTHHHHQSHHHHHPLRHQQRLRDHEMAMQQVAEWIKQEHSWSLSEEGDVVVHRHHHIHEHHHHHHYHHYYQT